MRIIFEIRSPGARVRPAVFARACRRAILGCALANRIAIRLGEVPPIYKAGVRWKAEPKGVESFVDAVTVWEKGHGDCAHLAAWRLAELLERGEKAGIHIYWRAKRKGKPRLYHVCVRRQDGSIEDPSRKLGMGRAEA